MGRLTWAALFVLFTSIGVAAPFQATVTHDVEVRDGALDTDPVVARIEAGATITVRDCILEKCLIELPGVEFENAPWASDSALSVDGTPAPEYITSQRLNASTTRHSLDAFPAVKSGAQEIWTEGDSYMAGAYGISLTAELKRLMPRRSVTNTALGGSSIQEARDRMITPANASLAGRVTIFWDGSPNGTSDPSEYVNYLQAGIDALQTERFVIVPPATPPGVDGSAMQAIIAEQVKARWPENVLDWTEVLPHENYSLTPEAMHDYPADKFHLNAASIDAMAVALVDFLNDRGW